MDHRNANTAYIIGVSIGDGNLSNPTGRSVRLRISCDKKYPTIQKRIIDSLSTLLPNNSISIYDRTKRCADISCYSNHLENILGWKALGGSKFSQNIRIPSWIFNHDKYIKSCLKGLFETDGSIYKDRKYTYVNFTTIIHGLSQDVQLMIDRIGYTSDTQSSIQKSGKRKFVTRICRKSREFIEDVNIQKE